MKKAIFLIILGSAVFAAVLAGCSDSGSKEPATDDSETMLSIIERSSAVTQGNLITKTENDDDGNINVNYYDNQGNLVEQFVWSDGSTPIGHYIMTYNDNNDILSKEELINNGEKRTSTSYSYDSQNGLVASVMSEYGDSGLLTKNSTYNANGELVSYSMTTYDEQQRLTQIDKYDDDGELEEYITYEYNDFNRPVKCSTFDSDGDLEKYTVFEYDGGKLLKESYFDDDGELINYFTFTYNDDGERIFSAEYDKNGNELSTSAFSDAA